MRALIQHRYGNEHDLTVEEVVVPEPGPGEIRVRVEACGANASDWEFVTGRPAYARTVAGLFRPKGRTLGSDVAGIVDAVGDRVTGFGSGDAVLADLFGTFGGFADRVVGPAKLWVKRVAGIDAVVAATLPQSGTIALTGVGDRVRAGMRVLIIGAGGGSGPLALQMAKAAGTEVWAVDNAAKLDLLRRLGADRVIDYRADDFTVLPERFDLVLAPGGRYMFVGGPVPVLLNLVIVGAILALGSDRKAGALDRRAAAPSAGGTHDYGGRREAHAGRRRSRAARRGGQGARPDGARRNCGQARRCTLTHRNADYFRTRRFSSKPSTCPLALTNAAQIRAVSGPQKRTLGERDGVRIRAGSCCCPYCNADRPLTGCAPHRGTRQRVDEALARPRASCRRARHPVAGPAARGQGLRRSGCERLRGTCRRL